MGRNDAVVVSFNPERLARRQMAERAALVETASVMAGQGFSETLPGF